jgi:hypothetical protein
MEVNMPTYLFQVTVQPVIPASLVRKKELEILKLFFNCELSLGSDGKKELYFFSEEYSWNTDNDYGNEFTTEALTDIFQTIIKRSKGRLEYIYLHSASFCSRMLADHFGGWVVFVREDSVEWFSTWDKITELTK